ncbi:MAG: hypothetical protein JSV88_03195 [Candidatus Aminicenantes bacterium]|nr:MAG: hypothetical protein JSV88_03195 [Candidatus Aminicenantes bacterium]
MSDLITKRIEYVDKPNCRKILSIQTGTLTNPFIPIDPITRWTILKMRASFKSKFNCITTGG